MKSQFFKKIIYPQLVTYSSIKLSSAPSDNDCPAQGYCYVWHSYVNSEFYLNIKTSQGVVKSHVLQEPSAKQIEIINAQIENISFTADEIVDNKLIIDSVNTIADVSFYTSNDKKQRLLVHLPIYYYDNKIMVSFEDINIEDYQFGGLVRFANGVVVLDKKDSIYSVPYASGNYIIDVNLGNTYVFSNVVDALSISKQNIKNLLNNEVLSVFVYNENNKPVVVDGVNVNYSSFFCSFLRIGDKIFRIGSFIELS